MLTVFRKEIKYIIPTEQFAKMEAKLDALMTRDKNGIRGTYPVRSQYYDSITDRDLWDNLDGVMEKRKIRLRVYSPEDEKVKLEYKCKSGTDGVKYSLGITRKEAEMMENHQYDFLLGYQEELAYWLYTKMVSQVYRPKTIVEYDRTAFIYPVSDVRITFDQRLRGSTNPYGLLEQHPFYTQLMPPDVGVLEVKYNNFLPAHLKRVVENIDHLAEASSKYSKARMVL